MSEISQRKANTDDSFTDKILKKNRKKRNRKRLIDTESKLMVARVEEGSGVGEAK